MIINYCFCHLLSNEFLTSQAKFLLFKDFFVQTVKFKLFFITVCYHIKLNKFKIIKFKQFSCYRRKAIFI